MIRVENLKECFCDVIPEFLSIENQVDLHQYNIREKEVYFGEYALINHHFQVPQDLCENIYATQYAKYFYSEKERKNLIAKWAE